jgi:hypothetical protein
LSAQGGDAVPLNPITVHVGALLLLHIHGTPPRESIHRALGAIGLS